MYRRDFLNLNCLSRIQLNAMIFYPIICMCQICNSEIDSMFYTALKVQQNVSIPCNTNVTIA